MSGFAKAQRWLAVVALSFGVTLTATHQPIFAVQPLQPVTSSVSLPTSLGLDDKIWPQAGQPGDRAALLAAIDHSLAYLQTPKAAADYQKHSVPGINRDRVRRSLVRFRQLVTKSRSAAELKAAVQREFVLYRAVGKDNQGTVAYTGYFEPTYTASRVRTAEYRYPLFRVPPGLAEWSKPQPTRARLEGKDGLQFAKGPLKNLELVWLRDRLEAFLIQVQGSARLQMTDGSTMTVGFAGKTNHPYTGVGRELVKDGKMRLEDLTLPNLLEYFHQHPEDLDVYLPRNRSFVFFRETYGAAATGSLGVPVTAERSIATDKSLMPPGALALIDTPLPQPSVAGKLEQRPVSRYVLDQDTGSAIKGPGRVDIFMGTGVKAGDRAGLTNSTGQLYYLLLKQ
ncbi:MULTISPECIES: murein transglycosylase A [Trichocoleus]|uniref:peptidoglycan lytic exotransglycosylase n=1 Tax=Trichocoleus desertorum GB2-A4 TaxID=2933944 RepID=A0ABV0J6F7_9CYAN|nr:murein transglycosylase A [Trichocoleus sp. FACHB-46]MBD1863481.1 murein transglycosylase A [Trichocoleus sp. FACHB-46]